MSIHNQLTRLQAIMKLAPSRELLDEVEAICAQENACKIFWCERLENPAWFPLMSERNWFADPPSVRREGEVTVHPAWIESTILLNFAKSIPTDIAKVLSAVPDTDNPRVGDQIIRIAAALRNPTDIRLVLRRVGDVIADRTRSDRLWLIDLLRNWLSVGATKEVIELLPQVFSFDASDEESAAGSSDSWELGQVDEHVLAPLSATHGKEVVTVLTAALDKLSRDNEDELFSTTLWLEDFGSNPGFSHQKEIIPVLRIYATCRELIDREGQAGASWVDDILQHRKWTLFRRLRWQLYSDFPEFFLEQARREVLDRTPQMSRVPHGFEFQNMITAAVNRSGRDFLSGDALTKVIEAIGKGPLTKDGTLDTDEGYVARFRAKQIQPFRPLLEDQELFAYRTPEGEEVIFRPENYKPIQFAGESHVIEQRSPITADGLIKLPDNELWALLNDWTPDPSRPNEKWWIEEGVDGLANEFAKAVELDKARFGGRSEWWKHLKRPAFFWRILDRVLSRENAPEPNEDDWIMWFGLCEFVVAQDPIEKPDEKGETNDTSTTNPTWKYARWSVARLIERVLKHENGPPLDYAARIASLLRRLATDEDPRLNDVKEPSPGSSFDWLSRGINSTAGTATEALLLFALWQRKQVPESPSQSWITDVLFQQLTHPNQSPAIFAVLGSQLALLVHLFPEWCRQNEEIIFPFAREPIRAEAGLLSHLAYNNPNALVIKGFPALLDQALRVVKFSEAEERKTSARAEVPLRLGYHLSYYYWNALPDEATAGQRLDRFFQLASAGTRGRVVAQIGHVFRQARLDNSSSELIKRAQLLWDKRFSFITTELRRDPSLLSNFASELESFCEWVEDDCFESRWRLARLSAVLELLERSPGTSDLAKTLEKLSDDPNNLRAVIRCVQLLTEKFSDPFRWSMRGDDLKTTIKRGLLAEDPETRSMAESARDNLLRHGLFVYQEI
jgi:hypothetical protein